MRVRNFEMINATSSPLLAPARFTPPVAEVECVGPLGEQQDVPYVANAFSPPEQDTITAHTFIGKCTVGLVIACNTYVLSVSVFVLHKLHSWRLGAGSRSLLSRLTMCTFLRQVLD